MPSTNPRIAALLLQEDTIGFYAKPISENLLLKNSTFDDRNAALIELRLRVLGRTNLGNPEAIPILISIPSRFWDETLAYVKSRQNFGFSEDTLSLIEEDENLTLSGSPENLKFQLASRYRFRTCSAGGTRVLEKMVTSGYLKSLFSRKTEWLMISNYTNLGASIDSSILGRLSSTNYDIIAEALDVADNQTLNTIVLEPPFSPTDTPFLCHRQLLNFRGSEAYISHARYGATGTYWIRLKSLAKHFQLDPSDFAERAHLQRWTSITKTKEDVLFKVDDQSFVLQCPLSILFQDFRLLPVRVQASRLLTTPGAERQ